ncbi:MAG: alginate lyase family protein [Bacteroidetes bacterium]|nr:alginate lyase family protein [Bacteroidota bacterium]
MYNALFCCVLLFLCPGLCPGQRLIVYPSTGALPAGVDLSVRARVAGGSWRDVPVYGVSVADGTDPAYVPRQSSMAYFDFTGRVEVEVRSRHEIGVARVRPLSYGIRPEVSGNVLRFFLDRPRNISVEVDGNVFDNLQLFAGAPPAAEPDRADSNTIYYGPGVHKVGTVRLTSGKQVYLAGGAVVEGQFLIDHQENVHIGGRGILFQPRSDSGLFRGRHDALKIDYSSNVSIDDIIVIPNTYTVLMGCSRGVQVRDIKSFSAGGNNDGIDVFCCEDVLIDGVFMRNSDDCIAIYGHRWGYYGNTRNIRVVNSTLWADIAHPVLVGTHGDPAHPDTLEDLRFFNIDVLDHHENQVDYQGCISIDAGDSNLVRRVRCEDIRVEDFRKGQLVNLRVMYNKKYNTAPGRGIEDVLFKDVSYNGTHAGLSIITGYDEGRGIRNVVFENLRINGVLVWDRMPGKPAWYKTSDLAGFYVGEHVDGLRFVVTGMGDRGGAGVGDGGGPEAGGRGGPSPGVGGSADWGEKRAFVHPGILLSAADLDHIRAVAGDHRMPEYGSFELLRDNPLASAGYKMKGPFGVISRDGDYSYTKPSFEADFSAAWLNTLMWVATGDSAHARRSLGILEAYADSLRTIPSTNDAPLLAGLEGMKIVNVMEILRYTYKNIPAATTGKINRMIVSVFMPVCKKFYDTPAYTNGNWGPIVTKAWMSAAIYFDDRAMYKKAVDFYCNADDNGTIRNYISGATGQIQESGRDQGHPQLGLGAMATVCQIAWNQGDDLYSALDNRLLRGFEYVAKYNLGFDDVPFATWKDVTGKYCDWTVISTKSRGHFIPVYEMVYNHYVRMEGLEMPYTARVLEKLRPEGYDRDQPGFGTLLYYGTGGTGKMR